MADILEVFDVDRWLQQSRSANLHVSQPYQVGRWTKTSARQGNELRHGDVTGADH